MWRLPAFALAWLLLASPLAAQADYRADARALDQIILDHYAYHDRLPGQTPPASERQNAQREAVKTRVELIAYAEAKLLSLADHHAIAGSSLRDSWAVVPSYADLWILREPAGYRVVAVRSGSPADAAGARVGDVLVAVGAQPVDAAVAAFWGAVGLTSGDAERDGFAARVLAAGRRDRPRDLTLRHADGSLQRMMLPSLYSIPSSARPPVSLAREGSGYTITIHNSLGENTTIAAFDAAMAKLPARARLTLDLTETPGGGNTTVARAILGWFVDRPFGYQRHAYPAELRRTGIARQWVEEVLPRPGKRHRGPVTVKVGRWTGSMGEGLAIGFDAIGARVVGSPMAGLLGAIYDFPLPEGGVIVKLPAERLSHIDGTPREAFRVRAP